MSPEHTPSFAVLVSMLHMGSSSAFGVKMISYTVQEYLQNLETNYFPFSFKGAEVLLKLKSSYKKIIVVSGYKNIKNKDMNMRNIFLYFENTKNNFKIIKYIYFTFSFLSLSLSLNITSRDFS